MKIRYAPLTAIAILLSFTILHAQDHLTGYRFATGQKLYYQRVFERNNPVFDDSYMQTQECEIRVESVDAAGNATIVLTVLKDTLHYQNPEQEGAGGFMIARLQPKIRFAISPQGAVSSGTILQYSDQYRQLMQQAAEGRPVKMLSDSERVEHEAAIWLPPLPSFQGSNVAIDTAVKTVELPAILDASGGGAAAFIKRDDTTITAARLVGTRDYAGVECQRLVRTTLSRQPFPGDRMLYRQEVEQSYARTSDGIPVHLEATSISTMAGEGAGIIQRTTQNLIGMW